MGTSGLGRRVLGPLCAVLLAAGLLAAAPPGASAEAPFDGGRTRFSGTPVPTGQTDGPVWAVEVAGGRIYAGGEFTSTRPSGAAAGARETGQGALAAFDADTGAPIDSFSPRFGTFEDDAVPTVWATALSPDGSRLYVGGNFNSVDGQEARRIAVFDTASGRFLGQVGRNGVDGQVTALAASPDGTTLYAGGQFTQANNTRRVRTAAFDVTTPDGTGGALREWSPQLSGTIDFVGGAPKEALRVVSLAVSSDNARVFVAGPFREVNGTPMQGFAATYEGDGSLVPGFRGDYFSVPYGWGTAVEVAGDEVYVGARDDGTSGLTRREGVYSLDSTTGAETWYLNCYGDTFGLQVVGADLYVASHAHDCSANGGHPETSPRTYLAIEAVNRATGRVKPYFVQTSGATQKTRLLSRALASDGRQLVMGGGYARVNERLQGNLTRFRTGSAAPQGVVPPQVSTCRGCRQVRVRVPLAFDRDDVRLRYEIIRRNQTGQPVRRIARQSVIWRKGAIVFRDRGPARGSRVFYRVRVSDPTGATRLSGRSRTVRVGRP